jgi:hypothetical protein
VPLFSDVLTALVICHWRADEMKQALAWLGRDTDGAPRRGGLAVQ